MSDPRTRRSSRRTTVIIVAVLVVVIVAVTVIGLISAGAATPAGTASPSAAVPSAGPASSAPAASGSPTVGPRPFSSTRTTPSPALTASTPQPTRTAKLSAPAPVPIVKSLSAEVTSMTAVQGAASGPGEIAGPSVRFTVVITNRTGASVDLSNTVVNAYAGADASPALPLQGPGGKAFPASVGDGAKATGVFVFNIPEADRSNVEVTVDTSVRNPVVAFRGAAPR